MLRFWLVLLLVLPVCAQSAITPGVGAGPVRLGQTSADVKAALGAPKEVRPSSSDPAFKMAFYDGLMVMLNPEQKVIGVTVMGTSFRTAEGLGVGSTGAEVQKAYGPAVQRGTGNWSYPGKGVGFTLNDQGKASHVYVFKPEGERPLLGDRQIIAGQRAGGIRLGAATSTVETAWGKPSQTRDLGGGRSLWTYADQGVRLLVAGPTIDAILLTTGDFITPDGLKMGATQAEVEQVYGKGYTRKGPGLFYAEKGIGFLLGKERVIEIQVLFPR